LIVKAGNEHTTYGVKRGLPYTQFLQIEVVKLKQYGVLQNILEKYALKPNCNGQNTNGESAASIRFEKVVLPFTIFAIGSIFAIIIMAFEKCLSKKKIFEDHKNKGWKQDDSDVAYRRQRVCPCHYRTILTIKFTNF
jgi:hypothetical protein